jgi:hypothetical protein
MRSRPHGQNWTRCAADDLICRRSEPELGDGAASVCAHDDEIIVLVARALNDLVMRFAVAQLHVERAPIPHVLPDERIESLPSTGFAIAAELGEHILRHVFPQLLVRGPFEHVQERESGGGFLRQRDCELDGRD